MKSWLLLLFLLAGAAAHGQDTIRASKKIRPGMAPRPADSSATLPAPKAVAAPDSAASPAADTAAATTTKADRNLRPGGAYARPGAKPDTAKGKEKLITKLKDTKIPPPLLWRISNMSPQEMQNMEEEWKRNDIDEESGDEMVFTTKLKFYEDYIIGFVAKAPLNTSNKGVIEPIMIDIPIVYCSTQSVDMQQHCGRVSELAAIAAEYKVTAWKLKGEEAEVNFADPLKLGGKDVPGKKGRKKKGKVRTGEAGVE